MNMNTPIDFFSFFFESIPLCELQKKYLPDNNVKLENFAQIFHSITLVCCDMANHIMYGWFWVHKIISSAQIKERCKENMIAIPTSRKRIILTIHLLVRSFVRSLLFAVPYQKHFAHAPSLSSSSRSDSVQFNRRRRTKTTAKYFRAKCPQCVFHLLPKIPYCVIWKKGTTQNMALFVRHSLS